MVHASLDAKAAVLWSYDSLTEGGLNYPYLVRGRGKYGKDHERIHHTEQPCRTVPISH